MGCPRQLIGFYKVNVNKTIKVGFKNIREKYG